MPATTTIGIIANPASGRDIRRLTAKASVFPMVEKANMVQRLLGAFGTLGVSRVLMMPDLTGIAAIVKRAVDTHRAEPDLRWPTVEFIEMPIGQTWHDTALAVRRMKEEGVRAIVVLGGDGTHRVVATQCGDIPIATLSSGTNNTFPDLREATTTGLATALVATGRVPLAAATRSNKLLRVSGRRINTIALVDVCVTALSHVASRALWQAEALRELFVAFAEADAIGLSSIVGLLHPVSRRYRYGFRVRFAVGDEINCSTRMTAPIAPGLLAEVAVAESARMTLGRRYPIRTPAGTIALDGEREFEFDADEQPSVQLTLEGPLTIDVLATLRYAARQKLMIHPEAEHRILGQLRAHQPAGMEQSDSHRINCAA